jgi:hypothetical protein
VALGPYGCTKKTIKLKKRFLWWPRVPQLLLRKRFPLPKRFRGPYSFSEKTIK